MGDSIYKSYILSVAFTPNARHIASGSANCMIKVIDADTGEVEHTLKSHSDTVVTVD